MYNACLKIRVWFHSALQFCVRIYVLLYYENKSLRHIIIRSALLCYLLRQSIGTNGSTEHFQRDR